MNITPNLRRAQKRRAAITLIGFRICAAIMLLPLIAVIAIAGGLGGNGAVLAMPASAAVINNTLTNYAQGYSQEKAVSLADFVAPVVATGVAQGQFKRFDDADEFIVYNTERAMGAGRTEIHFDADDPFYNCTPNGLKVTLDDHEREKAGDQALNLERAKIRVLINAQRLAREYKVWTAVRANLAAASGVGQWSSATVDPITELDAQIQAITTNIGMMPNRIAFGLGAWVTFRNHPKVIARQPGSAAIGLSTDQAAGMTVNPGIKIAVGTMSVTAGKKGGSKTKSNIIGDEVFLFYAEEQPDQFDPSFAKTFAVDASLVSGVKEFRHADEIGDVYAVDWTEQIQVTSTISARRIALS